MSALWDSIGMPTPIEASAMSVAVIAMGFLHLGAAAHLLRFTNVDAFLEWFKSNPRLLPADSEQRAEALRYGAMAYPYAQAFSYYAFRPMGWVMVGFGTLFLIWSIIELFL